MPVIFLTSVSCPITGVGVDRLLISFKGPTARRPAGGEARRTGDTRVPDVADADFMCCSTYFCLFGLIDLGVASNPAEALDLLVEQFRPDSELLTSSSEDT